MSDVLPAWSAAFYDGEIGPAPHLDMPAAITREWAFGDRSGEGVRVAVVDSGVQADHPLVGSVAQAVDVVVDEAEADGVRFVEGTHDDLYGHGTACASVIRGLAPGVELLSVRVLGSTLKGSTFAVAHGLEWCLDNGVHIANLSLSTANDDYYETFQDLLDQASYRSMMVVAAMNNERRLCLPSQLAGAFSVACAPCDSREEFWCNPDGPAQWGASGIDVDVAWLSGTTVTASGNSFAAPVVTGHLARLIGQHPSITPWQARTVLAQLAINQSG